RKDDGRSDCEMGAQVCGARAARDNISPGSADDDEGPGHRLLQDPQRARLGPAAHDRRGDRQNNTMVDRQQSVVGPIASCVSSTSERGSPRMPTMNGDGSGRKLRIGLLQINNSFSGQNYLPLAVGMLQAYAQKYVRQPEQYEFL